MLLLEILDWFPNFFMHFPAPIFMISVCQATTEPGVKLEDYENVRPLVLAMISKCIFVKLFCKFSAVCLNCFGETCENIIELSKLIEKN